MFDLRDIAKIRHHLHQNPEMGGEETKTSVFIEEVIRKNHPQFEIQKEIGGRGVLASREYGEGKHIAFRAELDALPVFEENEIEHRSRVNGKSHACGHDGHMSILLATLRKIEDSKPSSGKVSFLFQPAEETGQGADAMLNDANFDWFQPDALYALHNIPGKPMGEVMSRLGTFACGSVGVRLEIIGKTAHAAHPEDAVNPILLSQYFINEVTALATRAKAFTLVTPIALRAGEKTFGTTPLKSIILVTMRAELPEDLEFMIDEAGQLAEKIESENDAKIDIRFEEYFPVTRNDRFFEELREVCKKIDRPFREMDVPFRWSEDFGHFSKRCPTHMFGLGSGKETAPLHASTYDFPDELIEKGAEVFFELYKTHNPS